MYHKNIKKSCFLVASPQISQGIFHRSVILICEHSPHGSFGLIINKNLEMSKLNIGNEYLEVLKDFGSVELKIGGPVEPEKIIVVHNNNQYDSGKNEIRKDTYIGANLNIDLAKNKNTCFHLFAGYTGWSNGMLERELQSNIWFIYENEEINIFTVDTKNLWKNILLEMGGRYASMSTIPEDILMN